MTETPAKERKAAERARKRKDGWKLIQIWVRPEAEQKVRSYAESQNRKVLR